MGRRWGEESRACRERCRGSFSREGHWCFANSRQVHVTPGMQWDKSTRRHDANVFPVRYAGWCWAVGRGGWAWRGCLGLMQPLPWDLPLWGWHGARVRGQLPLAMRTGTLLSKTASKTALPLPLYSPDCCRGSGKPRSPHFSILNMPFSSYCLSVGKRILSLDPCPHETDIQFLLRC